MVLKTEREDEEIMQTFFIAAMPFCPNFLHIAYCILKILILLVWTGSLQHIELAHIWDSLMLL
jgi:hypothetical protein